MLPLMVGIIVTSISSGKWTTHSGRYKVFPIVGTGLLGIGIFLLSRLDVGTPAWLYSIYFFIVGAGLGLVMQILVLAVQNAVDFRDMGVATSSSQFFRSMGGTFGTAIFGTILSNQLAHNLAERLPAACCRAGRWREPREVAGAHRGAPGRDQGRRHRGVRRVPCTPCSSPPCRSSPSRSCCPSSSRSCRCARTAAHRQPRRRRRRPQTGSVGRTTPGRPRSSVKPEPGSEEAESDPRRHLSDADQGSRPLPQHRSRLPQHRIGEGAGSGHRHPILRIRGPAPPESWEDRHGERRRSHGSDQGCRWCGELPWQLTAPRRRGP